MAKAIKTSVKSERLVSKRREEMVKAAIALFSKKGFHQTTTREIAEQAGFSIGTMYEYIRQKEDVLYLVCDEIYDHFQQSISWEINQYEQSVLSLKQAITGFFYVMDELQDEVLIMYQESHALSHDALPYVLSKETEMVVLFEKVLQRCVAEGYLQMNDEALRLMAHNILVCGQMWAFRRWAFPKDLTIETYLERQLPFLLQGMGINQCPAKEISS